MAAGIRPNTALAEKIGLHCERGIVVNDTHADVTDPRIYAVGECAAHRGIAYGLVAPLFELAQGLRQPPREFGIGRYAGSQTSTKLKVTGIDLFSAGDFMGGEGTEEIVLTDPARGVYKKLVIKDDKLVGACLYGDTVDGAWYFKLLRDGRNIADDPRPADVRRSASRRHRPRRPQTRAAAMADGAEVCGCNGVSKGTIVKAIKEKGLFTLDEVRKHTKASGSCGSCTGLVEQILMATAGGDYSAAPKMKAVCGCTDAHPPAGARRDPRAAPAVDRRGPRARSSWRTPNGCASCRPALNYYLISTWPHEARGRSAVALHQRARARQHPEGRHLLGGAAHVGRRDQRVGAAPHRRRRRQVPDPDGQGHRRPAHRPARREEGGPAGGLEGPRHAVGPRLRARRCAP